MPPAISEDPGNEWLAWLFARVSLDEAAALFQSEPQDSTISTKPHRNGN